MDLNKLFLDLDKKIFTDVELVLIDNDNTKKFDIHKCILANSSDYFHNLFAFEKIIDEWI